MKKILGSVSWPELAGPKVTWKIGDDFTTGSGQWRVTDVGSRVIVAIKVSEVSDPSWLDGPPYAVVELVFDEYSQQAMERVAGSPQPPGMSLDNASTAVSAPQQRLIVDAWMRPELDMRFECPICSGAEFCSHSTSWGYVMGQFVDGAITRQCKSCTFDWDSTEDWDYFTVGGVSLNRDEFEARTRAPAAISFSELKGDGLDEESHD